MISSHGLTFAYGPLPASLMRFEDVHVPQGGTLLLAGRSGSGKSTWLSLAAGLLTPADGHIEVAGQVLGELSGAQRDAWRARTVGFLPQRLALSPALDVEHNLGLVYFAAGLPVDCARITEVLSVLGVDDHLKARPGSLSGGQAQRVALARSILLRPRVLLVDEPTASLDDESCHAAVTLLQKTASEHNATLVVATHDMRVKTALSSAQVLELAHRTTHPERLD